MGIFAPGFHDEAHRVAFLEAAAKTRFGAAGAPVCGAKTRDGGTCKKRPLSGERRCLRLSGPAAAKRYHAQLREALGRGEIDHATWAAREQRRLLNQLRERWRRDPWVPGATVDLGGVEEQFRADLALGGISAAALSPASLDRARWRWHRLCFDRKRPVEWAAFLRDDLPQRIRRDGSRPPSTDVGAAVEALFRVDAAPPPVSKRRRLDRPRLPAAKPASYRAKRTQSPPIDDERLAALWLQHGEILMRLVGDDSDERTLRWLAALLARVLDAPEDSGAAEAWRAAVLARRTG